MKYFLRLHDPSTLLHSFWSWLRRPLTMVLIFHTRNNIKLVRGFFGLAGVQEIKISVFGQNSNMNDGKMRKETLQKKERLLFRIFEYFKGPTFQDFGSWNKLYIKTWLLFLLLVYPFHLMLQSLCWAFSSNFHNAFLSPPITVSISFDRFPSLD